MRENDVIVIGGGLSGLMAAATAAKRGLKTVLLTKGAGALVIGGGIIDILGYVEGGKPLSNPQQGMESLAKDHPYQRIGANHIVEAAEFFLNICETEGYPYIGDLSHNQWIPTAAGTFKPTCLIPRTMNPENFRTAERIVVLGFTGLKDFYPQLIVKGLEKLTGDSKKYKIVMIDPEFQSGRDISALDIARWLDTTDGRRECIWQMKQNMEPGSAVLVPPVLGTMPNYEVASSLENAVNCRLIELAAMPPAVNGLRLSKLLVNYVKKLGVRIVEQASVTRAVVENGRCLGVVTANVDRERSYYAKSFILATGGFYGGGLLSEPGYAIEPIFQLHLEAPSDPEQWGNANLFSTASQPFAKMGVKVDDKLRPVDASGAITLENVHVAGRDLAGYDFCFEKSGNGVAIASGYYAGMSV